ncbi:ABC transporter ATP-binding protein [Nonomuraea fuscirosea]|uniref:ATP-binding cassette subfamily B protein n=1 Tax=Nonomuraea fuscirosea TaxID=1291556 RepID=A0A2T0N3Y6_9ACTN|nr:ABC transporter ATP-binding protein [Nonomuraea fuscirosea]PRX66866.1 ATP-binding cassette subfamily B protein [Nonomuraea fuscirosea]
MRDPRGPAGETGAGSLFRRGRVAAELAWRARPAAVLGSLALVLLMGAAPVATAWLTKLVIDRLANGEGGLLPVAAALGVAGLALVVLPHVSEYLNGQLHRGLQRLVYDRLFLAVNADPGLSRFENPSFHDELRLAHEAGQNAPQQIVGSSLAICQGVLTLLGFVVTLTVLSPVMVVIVIAAALPSARVQLALSRRRARTLWGVSSNTRRQLFYGALLTSPDAAKEVRLFRLGDFLRTRMLTELETVNEAERDLDWRTLRSQGLLSLLGAAVAAGGLFWAVLTAASGGLSVGDVSVFVAAVAGVQTALTAIVSRWAGAHNALLMFGHYVGVVQAEPGLPVAARPSALPALRAGIELRDVWFRYDDEHPWVLRGVDLFIPHGQAVALVGLNGAGKSTLVKLLCRLYDPVRGSILWDGVDLREAHPDDLRARIGVVFQDYMTYDLTAAENIMLGDLAGGADPEAVRAAARRAGIHDTLDALPRGYDTLLSRIFFGEGDERQAGVTLSGGQWQRLALARALMRHQRDLLILDEPSSGLDAEAEHAVHQGMRRHRAGRTSVLISHRLGALRDADLIVVLSDGKISERGTHDELMAKGEQYARLFSLQASGYEPAPEPSAASG